MVTTTKTVKEEEVVHSDPRDQGEVLLPGTREYAELVARLRKGEITSEEFLEQIYKALDK